MSNYAETQVIIVWVACLMLEQPFPCNHTITTPWLNRQLIFISIEIVYLLSLDFLSLCLVRANICPGVIFEP